MSIGIEEVLEEEYKKLHGDLPKEYSKSGSKEERLAAIYQLIHQKQPAALCLSGGGIRSATFALGLLQGLADCGLLEKFHYLSTVSGGGYIGSWLTAWIYRHNQGIQGVSNDLSKLPALKVDPEPAPLRHLRAYSNYMTPKLGLLSADTWTLPATYLRNLLLNWLVLIPLLCAVLAIPRLGVPSIRSSSEAMSQIYPWLAPIAPWLAPGALFLGAILTIIAIAFISFNLPSAREVFAAAKQKQGTQTDFLVWCLLPLVGAAITLVTYWAWYANPQGEQTVQALSFWPFAVFGMVVHFLGWILYARKLLFLRKWKKLLEVFLIVFIGLLGGGAVWWFATTIAIFSAPQAHAEAYVCFAVPLLLSLFLLAMTFFVGIASHYTDDNDREWWARCGAWVLIAIVVWIIASTIVIYGPTLLFKKIGPWIVTLVGGISGLVTILLGRSPATSAQEQQEQAVGRFAPLKNIALALAAPLFVVVLIVILSLGTSEFIAWLWPKLSSSSIDALDLKDHQAIILNAPFGLVGGVSLFMGAFAFVMGLFINVNKFSLHSGYRNRLIRAYLGASREKRHQNPFTGFDPDDNISIAELAGQDNERMKQPFHVINITLNLVKGENLAWQQRKAESFTVTPLYSGNYRLGYRRSRDYGGEISLGTAVAISGAAASPNMGYHSSPALTFLMTLFNARLGWWLGNPGEAGNKTFHRPSPWFAVGPIIQEALGLTNDTNPYVYLSDGGHFENLGLYEMVLRRCHTIVVSDAGCDLDCSFEDLGNAIRKIRVDLGVPIHFDKRHIYARKSQKKGRYCAIGTIQYSAVDPGRPDGTLIYIKPAFYGDEPTDIFNYATMHSAFPHESTSDQWFSESQFESYRMLGFHIIRKICKDKKKLELDDFIKCAQKHADEETPQFYRSTQDPPTESLSR